MLNSAIAAVQRNWQIAEFSNLSSAAKMLNSTIQQCKFSSEAKFLNSAIWPNAAKLLNSAIWAVQRKYWIQHLQQCSEIAEFSNCRSEAKIPEFGMFAVLKTKMLNSAIWVGAAKFPNSAIWAVQRKCWIQQFERKCGIQQFKQCSEIAEFRNLSKRHHLNCVACYWFQWQATQFMLQWIV